MLPQFPQSIGNLPRQLKLVRELEQFEGPILSELRAEDGGVYLEKWCASEGLTARSLVVRTEPRAVAEYLARRMTLLDLLVGPSDGVGFIVDRIDDTVEAVYIVHIQDLPPKYLPQPSARHDPSLRPFWSSAQQSFLLDGDWDAKLLAIIERKYLDVFAFTYFTHAGSAAVFPQHVLRYVYDGGYPYMHAFGQLRHAVPRTSRAKSIGVSANSPGVLTIEAPVDIADRVTAALAALPVTVTAYNALHEWSKLKPEHVSNMPANEVALADIRRLSQLLAIDAKKVLPVGDESTFEPGHVLAAGKLVASYWRRLVELMHPGDGVEFLAPNVMADQDLSALDEDEDEDSDTDEFEF